MLPASRGQCQLNYRGKRRLPLLPGPPTRPRDPAAAALASLLAGGGQGEADRRALPELAVDGELAAVGQHKVLDDSQAQARRAELTGASLVHAVEALRQPRQ